MALHVNNAVAANAAENAGSKDKADKQLIPLTEKSPIAPKTERRMMTLPVTGTEIELTLQRFDPDELSITSLNKRMQHFVSADNEKIINLKQKIEREGQLEPVLVRIKNGKPELVYGSRRRFVISLINKERRERGEELIKIQAWRHTNISDVDARRLAASENDDKEPISPYEDGRYYKKLQASGKSIEAIADEENVSVNTVYARIRIEDLDIKFIDMLPAPTYVTQTGGDAFIILVNKAGNKKTAEFLSEFENVKFDKMIDLTREFEKFTKKKPKKSSAKAKAHEVKIGNKVKAKMTPNRDDKTKFKIDVFDMNEEQQEEMKRLLESWEE